MIHLSNAEILSILNENIEGSHLAGCRECQDRAVALRDFQVAASIGFSQASQVSQEGSTETDGCVDTEDIVLYIEEGVNRDEISAHIDSCQRCFELASYYFVESAEMSEEKMPETPKRYRQAALGMVGAKTKKTKRSIRLPRWIAVPLPAFAAAAFMWAVLIFSPSATEVAVSSNTPDFTVFRLPKRPLPYFYFRESGERIGALPAEMKIRPSTNYVNFYWAEVEGIGEYHFILQALKEGRPHTVKQLTMQRPTATIRRDVIEEGVTYRWIAAGGLKSGNYFVGRMDFSLK